MPRTPEQLVKWLVDRGSCCSGSEYLRLVEPVLAKFNVEVDREHEDMRRRLQRVGAEGVTYNWGDRGILIILRDSEPSISAVLEELAHAAQYLGRRGQDADIRSMQTEMEIQAKECLTEHAQELGIPEDQTEETRMQLEDWYAIRGESFSE